MQPSSLSFLVVIAIWAAYLLQHWLGRREHLTTARSVDRFSESMRILDRAGKIAEGSVMFSGIDVGNATEDQMRDLRGREISMIFQSPRTALNPIRPVGLQIEDVLRRHAAARGADLGTSLRERAVQALREVAISDPERRHGAYPFEMSGGMCQRVMIALALACRPALLIADEPTGNLDSGTAQEVLAMFTALCRDEKVTLVMVTHDAVVAGAADRVIEIRDGVVVAAGEKETKLPAIKGFQECCPRAQCDVPQGGIT